MEFHQSYFKSPKMMLWKYCTQYARIELAYWENSIVARGLKNVSFPSNPKERQCQRMFKLPHNCTHLRPSKSESEVTQSCPTLCYPMHHSMPGLPAHHQLLEFTQIHVHWVGDAIQPSQSLSSSSPLLLLPSIFPSIRVFSNRSVLLHNRWPKY